MLSSVARTMRSLVMARIRPTRAPRAFMSQWGGVKAGKGGDKIDAPLSWTLRAKYPLSEASSKRRRLSRSHCTAAQAMAMEPSRA